MRLEYVLSWWNSFGAKFASWIKKRKEWVRHFNNIKKELKVCIKGTHRSMFEPKKFHENNAVRFAFFPAAGVGFRLVLPSR